jgi:formylglycine-generating enzyme required for sulfatase activity
LDDEKPQHLARITRAFYLGAHEVTVGQFRQFVDETAFKTIAETSGKGGTHIRSAASGFVQDPRLNWRNPGFESDERYPVVQVSWDDCVAFCTWLSEKEGARYRLPTEAEWEFACRAGSSTTWSFGDVHGTIQWSANVADRRLQAAVPDNYDVAAIWDDGYAWPSPVGSFLPNALGLYDMHGNVFEWCSDWYDPVYYSYAEADDPQGPKTGTNRIQRSGSCLMHYDDTRSSHRDYGPPAQVQSQLGFRVVREIR